MEVVNNWIKDRECPVCKKRFAPAPYHVYKDARSPYRPPVCSYSCARESQRIVAAKRQGKKREKRTIWTPENDRIMLELKKSGETVKGVAEKMGIKYETVKQRYYYLKTRQKPENEVT